MFSRSFLRSEDFLLQNSAILRNAARMLNRRIDACLLLLSVNTLDSRRNCRHHHILGRHETHMSWTNDSATQAPLGHDVGASPSPDEFGQPREVEE